MSEVAEFRVKGIWEVSEDGERWRDAGEATYIGKIHSTDAGVVQSGTWSDFPCTPGAGLHIRLRIADDQRPT